MFSCTGLIIAVTFCVVLLCHFCEEKWRFSCKNIHTTSVEGVWSKDFFADDQIIHINPNPTLWPPFRPEYKNVPNFEPSFLIERNVIEIRKKIVAFDKNKP